MFFDFIFIALSLCAIKVSSYDPRLFKEITSYRTEDGENVKNVLVSNSDKDDWLNAYMFCQKNDLELLRIESYKELLKVKKALKIHWHDFGDILHIDGVRLVDRKWGNLDSWEFLFNEKIIDFSIINDSLTNRNNGNSNCLAIRKINVQPKIFFSNCFLKGDFLCQEVFKTEEEIDEEEEEEEATVIDVRARLFEYLGDFCYLLNSQKVYKSRFKLSTFMAENFCSHFQMSLVKIESQEKLNQLLNLLKNFDGTLDQLTIGSYHTATSTISRQCPSVSTNDQFEYISSKKCDGSPREFICEEKSSYDSQENRTLFTGMKLLGTFQDGFAFKHQFNSRLSLI